MSNVVEQYMAQAGVRDRKIVDVVSVRQAAQILGVKVYTARTLEWDGAFGNADDHRRQGRKGVNIPKSAVEQYKKDNPGIGQGREQGTGVSRTQRGQQVVDACIVIAELILGDKEITDKVFRDKMNTMLTKYTKIAETLIK